MITKQHFADVDDSEIKSDRQMQLKCQYLQGFKDGVMSQREFCMDVLDKIRAEIERLHHHPKLDFINNDKVVDMALEIIDKYKPESEGKE